MAEILVNATPREVRIALLENSVLQDIFIERSQKQCLIGNIYKGKITRLLPGIQAAFVDIGFERAGFLHSHDISDDEKIDIRDKVRVGQELLVQVCKDPLGTKGARLTTQIAIPSRYLVLTPRNHQVIVSQKISNETERLRLQSLLSSFNENGFIVRTAAEGTTKAEIESDKNFLVALWQGIKERSASASGVSLVYEEIPPILKVLRDSIDDEISRIRVDHFKTYEKMCEFAKSYTPELLGSLEYYSELRPIFDIYSVEAEIQKALSRKVHLKSGGYVVFDQTEAMTTIDVNTGSFTGRNDVDQTIFKTNSEAVEVIARQVRLRNLGGIIIVDFIDMQNPTHKSQLIESLMNLLAKDKMPVELSEISNLGLVQMTRKRTRESLENILCVTCPACYHRGTIKSLETLAYEIFRELKRSANLFPWNGFLVIAAESVINYLLETEASMIAELEQQLGKSIKLRVEGSYMQEQYDILPLSEKE